MSATPNGLLSGRSNTGKSMYIAPDPASQTNFVSLNAFPIQPGSEGATASATLVNCVADDANSEVVTLTLDNPNPFAEGTITTFGEAILARPKAKIEWGVNGVQSTAFVDYDHGLQLSLPGSFLRVTGINTPIPTKVSNVDGISGQLAFGRNVKLGAFCGYGSTSGTRNLSAKHTLYVDEPPGVADVYKIPDFATNLTVQRTANTDPLTIFVLDEGGLSIVSVTYPAGGGFENPIELSGDAAFLFIAVYPASVSAIRFIFGLNF